MLESSEEELLSLINQYVDLFNSEDLIIKKAEIMFKLSNWDSLIDVYITMAINSYRPLSIMIDNIFMVTDAIDDSQLAITAMENILYSRPNNTQLLDIVIDLYIDNSSYANAIKHLKTRNTNWQPTSYQVWEQFKN